MDMFDFSTVIEFAKINPSSIVPNFLLFMIWLNSRGLKKEIHALRENLAQSKSAIEDRFSKVERRVLILESRRN